jgi:hypothetical protein
VESLAATSDKATFAKATKQQQREEQGNRSSKLHCNACNQTSRPARACSQPVRAATVAPHIAGGNRHPEEAQQQQQQ